ncbi:hypothetical protein [Methylobacillus flagellatus]|nr:hypothetical protein [Methylobacillus flagellatus]
MAVMLPVISINHAPLLQDRPVKGIVTLLLAAACGIALLGWMQQLNSERQRLNADLQQMQAPVSAPRLNPKEDQAKQQEIAAVQAAMHELALPWQKLFLALESIKVADIKLASIEPNARLHKLRITANTNEVVNMFKYVRGLSEQSVFNDVLLMSHEFHHDQPMPVRFVVEAVWIQQP